MRFSTALILFALPVCAPVCSKAGAQVTTDDHALDALKPAPPAAIVPGAPPAPARHHHVAPHAPRHTTPPRKPAPLPNVPAAPPANPVIAPPPFVMPARKPPPPPPVPLRKDATGAAQTLPGGARITFGPGSADLNDATLAAVQHVAALASLNSASVVSILAYAPGTPEDPSTPRRISLDRALSVRAALLAAGIPSERIRPLPSGFANIGADPADRADITLITPPPPKPASSGTAHP